MSPIAAETIGTVGNLSAEIAAVADNLKSAEAERERDSAAYAHLYALKAKELARQLLAASDHLIEQTEKHED